MIENQPQEVPQNGRSEYSKPKLTKQQRLTDITAGGSAPPPPGGET